MIALGLGACGGGDPDPATTPVASASAPVSSTPAATTSGTPTSSSSSGATSSPSPSAGASASADPAPSGGDETPWIAIAGRTEYAGSGSSSITGVRLGMHQGYERIVVDLAPTDGDSVGWFANPTGTAVQDFSGEPLDVDGDRFLDISLTGIANGADGTTDSAGRQAFRGDVDAPEGAELVEEVHVEGAWEGQAQVVVGLDDDVREYRLTRLSDPARIVVDVR
ncbi:hypothetical protein ACFFKU_00885 [Kineococcus gynurae]|uniref:AMIN-like domain-containing protein n=1 Tax=Kineococcus gynurae TaxID=452979 RepID=A0ABV5LPU9_9ACTN